MNEDYEILAAPTMWEPSLDLNRGIDWKTDKCYPGAYFYYDNCEDNLIEVLTNILDRAHPRSPESQGSHGGQQEYFKSADRDIVGIALLPKDLLKENQITKDYTDPDSQVKIRIEGNKRLENGLSYHKNPPIVTRSSTESIFGIQSGHNRTEDFQNRFPDELMLVIIVGSPKIHRKASCKLADARSRLRANPPAPTRSTTIDDMTLAIKEAFDADPLIHDIHTGEPYNPKGTDLTGLDKGGEVWINIFEYICGDTIHSSTRTKVYNKVTGNKVIRKKSVTSKTISEDLHEYGWADGSVRDKSGKIQQDYKRVPWHEHTDEQNGALIVAKEVTGTHFDTAMYALLVKACSDNEWSESLREKGINKVYLHANLGSKIDSEKSLAGAQDKVQRRCLEYNKMARQLGILEIKKVIFPQQQEKIDSRLIDIEELELEQGEK